MSRSPGRLLALTVVALAVFLSVASVPLFPDPPPAWIDRSEFPLEMGIGAYRFDRYDEGEPLPMQQGFQGGQHVNTNLRALEVEPGVEGDIVMWAVASDDSVVVSPVEGYAYFEDGAAFGHDDEYSYDVDNTMFVERPEAVLDNEIELRLQVTLGDGRVGRVSFRGVVEWLPADWSDEPPYDGGPPGS